MVETKTGNKVVLMAEEIMDIQTSSEIKEILLKAIAENEVIEINNEKTIEYDLTYPQLLFSANLYANIRKKQLSVINNSSKLAEDLKAFNFLK